MLFRNIDREAINLINERIKQTNHFFLHFVNYQNVFLRTLHRKRVLNNKNADIVVVLVHLHQKRMNVNFYQTPSMCQQNQRSMPKIVNNDVMKHSNVLT